MTTSAERDALTIIRELHDLTSDMVKRIDEPDFLVEGVEHRQALMDEYDAYSKEHPYLDKTSLKKLVSEVLAMDEKINSHLLAHKSGSKRKLIEIRSKQQTISYGTGTAAAGSFMNYTK